MAMEPITLFSREVDPAGVAQRLRQLVPDVTIVGPDAAWREATVTFAEGKRQRTLTFTHDSAYYAEPSWSTQMAGMRGYFARFPDTDRKALVMNLTTSLKFSLGTLFDPDFDPQGDPRLEILLAIAQFLDGVLFTPSTLRDARGRILFGAGGEKDEDPHAVWPRVLGEVALSGPGGMASTAKSEPTEGEEDRPPSARRVARRALALTAVTARAILEQNRADKRAARNYQTLMTWIQDTEIGDELEPDEWEVLQRPPGKLDQRGQIHSTWRLEGLAVLAWGLNRGPLPSHDQLVDPNPLWTSLGFPDAGTARALLDNPQIRPRGEIETLRKRLFALHWRLRNYFLNRKILDFAEFAQTCWFGPLDITGLPLVDRDLGLRGNRIDRASSDIFSRAHSAAQERHQAANWLWEGPDLYSQACVAT